MRDEYVIGAVAVAMFIFCLIFMIIIMINPGRPRVPEWYSPCCCSGKDCAPARVEHLKDGRIRATTIHGTEIFGPETFRPSRDGRYHACILKSSARPARCIYIPAGV